MEKSSILGLIGVGAGILLARMIFDDSGFIPSIVGGAIGGGLGGGLSALIDELIRKKKQKNQKISLEKNDISPINEVAVTAEQVSIESTKLESNNKPIYYGFGGWLYLVTIGQIFTLYNSFTTIFEVDLPLINSTDWDELTTNNGSAYSSLWKPFIYAEILGSSIFILLIVVIAFLTIRLSRHYKKAQITLYIYNIVYSLIAMTFMLAINSNYETPLFLEGDFTRIIVQTITASAIWIPYFIVSKRVKNTFVK